MSWELSKIHEDGSIEVANNSRTGLGQETFFGRAKDIDYQEIIEALYLVSALNNNPDALQAANKVSSFISQKL